MDWYRMTLLDEKYEKIIDKILWTIIIFLSAILFAYNFGRNEEAKEQERIIQEYKEREESAIYLTVDESGAWLGSRPGAKETPLYNQFGEQVGKLKEVVE